jgi:DNA-binding MarR family transcriptional regulator
MYQVFRASKPYIEVVASAFDLTPQQFFALRGLGEDGQMTMSAFAQTMGCDASNVTSIIDKLESRGFVDRRPSLNDRRVKELVLTESGAAIRHRIIEAMHASPPPAIANLSREDQETIGAVFRRALDSL